MYSTWLVTGFVRVSIDDSNLLFCESCTRRHTKTTCHDAKTSGETDLIQDLKTNTQHVSEKNSESQMFYFASSSASFFLFIAFDSSKSPLHCNDVREAPPYPCATYLYINKKYNPVSRCHFLKLVLIGWRDKNSWTYCPTTISSSCFLSGLQLQSPSSRTCLTEYWTFMSIAYIQSYATFFTLLPQFWLRVSIAYF